MAVKTKLIADISKHNESFNGKTMKNAGVGGVIIRAGYRSASKGIVTQDVKYVQFIKEAVKNKIPIGVYWWTQSLSDAEAKEEANKCIEWVKEYKLSFPIFLDLEFYNSKKQGRADHLSAEKRTQYALTFIKQCNKLGYDCGVYCNPDFWKADLVPSKLNTLPRWIAHYGKSSGVDCDMWQYTSTANGKKYGCGWKYIDLSYMYTDFISGKKSKFSKEINIEIPKKEEIKKVETNNNAPSKTVKWVGCVIANTLNVRAWAGTENKIVDFSPLKKGAEVFVCDTVKDKDNDDWYYINYKGKFGFCSAKYIEKNVVKTDKTDKIEQKKKETTSKTSTTTTEKIEKTESKIEAVKEEKKKKKIDYRALSEKWMNTVYDKVVEVGCQHKGGAKTYADIIRLRRTTCTTTISAVFQQAGILPKGKKISHTTRVGGSAENILKKKKSLAKAMTGYKNLDLSKCKIVYIGAKNWASVPSKYKVVGAAYIQDSNGFMYMGKNKAGKDVNRSCNSSGSQVKKDKHGVERYYNNKMTAPHGYTYKSPVLFAVIPNS